MERAGGWGANGSIHISASELPAVHAAALLSSTSRPTADSLAVPARRGSYDRSVARQDGSGLHDTGRGPTRPGRAEAGVADDLGRHRDGDSALTFERITRHRRPEIYRVRTHREQIALQHESGPSIVVIRSRLQVVAAIL